MNNFEKTKAFSLQAESIKKEVKEEYAPRIAEEQSYILKFILRIKQNLETRKRIRQISSDDNLHIAPKSKSS